MICSSEFEIDVTSLRWLVVLERKRAAKKMKKRRGAGVAPDMPSYFLRLVFCARLHDDDPRRPTAQTNLSRSPFLFSDRQQRN